jgi:hypothetical protein
MDIYTLLIIGHIIGAILGVGGATFIEIHLNMALQDGKMDRQDRAVLGKDFLLTRIGMALGFLTGVGFVIIWAMNDQLFRLMDGVFWSKMLIFLIIIVNAYLLHKHKIGLYWGSAFSFISWWAVMLLGIFLSNSIKFVPQNPTLSFFAIMIVYAFFVVIGAVALDLIRKKVQANFAKTTAQNSQIPG